MPEEFEPNGTVVALQSTPTRSPKHTASGSTVPCPTPNAPYLSLSLEPVGYAT